MASRTKSAGRKGRAARKPQAPPAARRVERVRRLLLRRGLPRVQMSLILAATGAAGFIASFVMLHLGVWRMWVRYPLAVLFAYAVFIVLLRVWLLLHGREPRGNTVDSDPHGTDLATDIALDSVGGTGEGPGIFGGGGDFGGGGAGGSWGDGIGSGVHQASTAYDAGGVSSGGGGGGGGDWLSGLDIFDADSEGCVFFLLALALIVAGVCASLYVVYAAPLLLAEILVEGVLLSGLYRGMRRARRDGDWLGAAVRRTWLPVLLTIIMFTAAGYLLQRAAPRARSIGEAFRAVTSD
ncbi:MAG TPA: hypothetical protein VF297_26205 [Pyrinomonadaceae bacterium]